MRRAAIDIGSNSILLFIGDIDGKNIHEVYDEARVTGLGKDLDKTKCFTEESMSVSREVLCDYARILGEHGVEPDQAIVTATEASRVAQNAQDFFLEIEKLTSLKVKTISGEGEAFYTSLGVLQGLREKRDPLIVLDIGGASTELINLDSHGRIRTSVSLAMGSVRATDWLVSSEFERMTEQAMSACQNYSEYEAEDLVCVAGTMTSIGAMIKGLNEYDGKIVHTMTISRDSLILLINELSSLKVDEILDRYPFLGKRAKTILGGALIAKIVAEKLNVNKFEISTYGLRHGVVFSGGIDEKFTR